ncbi:MAG: CHAT domain-containing protein [Microcystaceae cyanobacterium]
MKKISKVYWINIVCLAINFLCSQSILAQSIVPADDGTGTVVNQQGNYVEITGGTLSGDGSNLFHSLEQLGLSANQIATFLSDPQIRNILTRVVGGDPSVINGLLQVTGGNSNLFIMNPSGVIFGTDARINVPSDFAVTTATGIGFGNNTWFNAVGENDYVNLMGNPSQFVFDIAQSGSIVNAGVLTVGEGNNLSLIGGNVVNTGTLNAPNGNITIAAIEGTNLLRITSNNSLVSLVVEVPQDRQDRDLGIKPTDLATLLTIGGENNSLLADVINNQGNSLISGEINTNSLTNGGNITIVGNRVEARDGEIRAIGNENGGNIRIGGDLQGLDTIPSADVTIVDSDTVINADSQNEGEGGNIIIWGNSRTTFEGSISARGGLWGGDGGFVEISGKNDLIAPNVLNNVDISAPNGQAGTLLIDPNNIIIQSGTGSPINDDVTNATPLSASEINLFLENQGNLTITTTGDKGEIGNIVQELGANITWSTGNQLTLNADNNIELNASIEAQGLGSLILNAGNNINLNSTSSITLKTGILTLNGDNNITINSPITTDSKLTINNSGLTTISQPLNLQSLETDQGGTTQINTLVRTSEGSQVYQDQVVIGNSITLIGNDFVFNDIVNSEINENNNLTLLISSTPSNRGQIIFKETVGGVQPLGNMFLVSSDGITFDKPLKTEGNLTLVSNDNIIVNEGINSGGIISIRTFKTTKLTGDIIAQEIVTDRRLTSAGDENQTIIHGNIIVEKQEYNDFLNVIETGTLVGNEITFNQSVTGTGSLTIAPLDNTHDIIIGSTQNNSNQLNLTQNDINNLQEVNSLTIGGTDGQGTINIESDTTFNNQTITLQGQNITQDGHLIVNHILNLDATENIILTNTNNDFTTVAINQGQNVVLTDMNDININSSQITGNLQLNSAGTTRLNGDISANRILTDEMGKTEIQGTINTQNEQTYNDPINLVNESTLSGTDLSINHPLQGNNYNLTLNFSETVTTETITNTNNLTIIGQQGIETENISAQGNITLNSDRFVRVRQGENPSNSSILTTQGSNITITHGEPIFEVETSQFNYSGTANQINNQQDTISEGTTLTGTFTTGNIAIIFTNPSTPDPETPNPDPELPTTEIPPITEISTEVISQNELVSITNSVNNSENNFSSTNLDISLNNNAQITVFNPSSSADIEQTEQAVSTDFKTFLAVEGQKNITLDDSQKILQIGYENTNIRTGIIYAIFQPSQKNETLWRYDSAQREQTVTSNIEDEQLILMLVTQDGAVVRKRVNNVTRGDIIRTYQELQATILNPRRPTAYLKPSQQFYQWLIAPLETELNDRKIENIAFILDSGLRSLPVAALHDGERFLIERYSMAIMPSLSLTDFRYRNLQGEQVLAMGASEFTEQNPLPAVPIELSIITEQLWEGKNFLNEGFTLNNLNQARQQQPFRIIHLATHAKFAQGELNNSYIQLWDERLQVAQLRDLNLGESSVDLLVLSACQTALGDKNAELGFAGAAVLANVKSVLGSLWEVSDEGTLGLMTVFYQSLQTAPTKSQALQQAQLSLLNKTTRLEEGKLVIAAQKFELPPVFANMVDHDLSHPYYWAAFTLIGNPW